MSHTITKLGAYRLRLLIEDMSMRKFDGTFHMNFWYVGPCVVQGKPGDCGTTACAGGFGTLIAELREAGLTLDGLRTHGYALLDQVFCCDRNSSIELFGGGLHNVIRTPKQWAEYAQAWLDAANVTP
jgi:hypothetical protein